MTTTMTVPCYTFQHVRQASVAESLSLRAEATIHCLPDDLLLLIIGFVDVKDILALRKTSRRFYSMTKLRWVWHDAMKRHVIDKGLPVPAAGIDLKTFSAEHLEARAVHAARFHENWCSPQPKPRRSIEFHAAKCLPEETPEQHRPTVSQVLFLPGCNGEFLVTLVGRTITCWEVPLDGSGAYRVAEWVSSQKVDQIIVNEEAGSRAVLAYVTGDTSTDGVVDVCALGLDKFHGRFVLMTRLKGNRNNVLPLHAMRGEYVLFGDPLVAWFFRPPVEARSMGKLHGDVLVPDRPNKILAVKVIGRYVLVVREQSFQLDYAPVWNRVRTWHPKIRGACVHVDLPVSDAVVVARTTGGGGEGPCEWPAEPVTVLARCNDDGLDTIQQFDLLPLPAGAQRVDEPFRVPCVFPEVYTHVVVVPPSCGRLSAGPGGKGFWMQTRNVTTRHSTYPARCLMGFHVTSNDEPGDAKARVCEGNNLHLCSGNLYSRRCDMGEILWKKYSIVSTALEDTVGRIAIGDRTGRVEVLDFA
ncbi:hypothetical protein AcW1_008854 [Taiwanofungus camphoratus]|nr:hypothetical protein AcV7_007142 [Antrodia cinnamomea]KAI0949163.1 hypothetical protein AcW1_008854 [Antrodia cinnamomea]